MPFDTLDEELKKKEQGDVEDQFAGLDKGQRGDEVQKDDAAATQEEASLDEALEQAAVPPQLNIRSIEQGSKYEGKSPITIPIEVHGPAKSRMSVDYVVTPLDASGDLRRGTDQVDLDESGTGTNDWSFQVDLVGRYLVEVRMRDSAGTELAQQVLIEVIAPEQEATEENPATEPKTEGTADGDDGKVAAA